MIKLDEIALDYEPRRKILPKLKDCPTGFRNPDMSEFDSAFLCSLLKTCRPKKILEVGVSNGVTTSIILQTLEDIGQPFEMYSVDLSNELYYDKTKNTGHVAAFAKENNLFAPQSTLCGEHKFYLGKYLPQVIDEICGDIDFVILDTVHYTPGELLDFPVMLPYIKDGSVVVLHDIVLNQANLSWHKPDAHATGLLLSAVTAHEKFLNSQAANTFNYPNIGAFRIDESTRANIENVFLALMLTWNYLPKDDEVKIYREFYQKHYPEELLTIFDEAVRLNRGNVAFKKKEDDPPKNEPAPADILTYQTHVASKGWSKWISENRISNDTNQKLQLEAIKINSPSHKVYYSIYYDEKEGWTEEVAAPEQAGTTGKRKPIMGIRIRLDEAGAKDFDILYRVHELDGSWTAWAKNYETIYSHGRRLNAIQIKLEPK